MRHQERGFQGKGDSVDIVSHE